MSSISWRTPRGGLCETGSALLLYHGSAVEIQDPDVSVGRKKLDFGLGFYTTTMPAQAEGWAKRRFLKSYEVPQ
ncbi:MAG: DUF3990 domain-containing protein [Coriobacteriales bacterium]|nr:DUF3990 domain-containing protein [Coriobacteriales bacterium]